MTSEGSSSSTNNLTIANPNMQTMPKAKQRADSGGDATGLLPMILSSTAPTATAAANRSAALS
eukprot:19900-Heterococcus_DN1.PRE.1